MALDCRIPLSVGRNALDQSAETLDRAVQEDENGNNPENDVETTADVEYSVVKIKHGGFDTEGGPLVYHFNSKKSLSRLNPGSLSRMEYVLE